MLRDALDLGDNRNKKIDHNQSYIVMSDLELYKANGREVDRILHKNTVFKIGEAPIEYHSTLEALVKTSLVETFEDPEILQGLEALNLDEGLEKVRTTKTIAEEIGEEEPLGEGSSITIPSLRDGKIAIESSALKKINPTLTKLKAKLEKRMSEKSKSK
jgi:hypothetical protein